MFAQPGKRGMSWTLLLAQGEYKCSCTPVTPGERCRYVQADKIRL